MKFNRRILGLERHGYAPELNTLVLKCGACFEVPKSETLKQAISLIKKKSKFSRYVKINIVYPQEFSYLNRNYSGSINSSQDLLKFIKCLKSRHQIDTSKLVNYDLGSEIIRAKVIVNFKRLTNCKLTLENS